MKFLLVAVLALAHSAGAFTPSSPTRVARRQTLRMAAPAGRRNIDKRSEFPPENPILKEDNPLITLSNLLVKTEEKGILTQLAETKLLSRAEAAGLTLADIEPLLYVIEENGVVAATGDIGADLLPLLPKLIDTAPVALPLVAGALKVPAPLLALVAAGGPVAAYVITSLPDDSIASVALQTFLALPLATVVPAGFGALAFASSKLN